MPLQPALHNPILAFKSQLPGRWNQGQFGQTTYDPRSGHGQPPDFRLEDRAARTGSG